MSNACKCLTVATEKDAPCGWCGTWVAPTVTCSIEWPKVAPAAPDWLTDAVVATVESLDIWGSNLLDSAYPYQMGA